MSQLLITGGKCVGHDSIFEADILVDDGKIVSIGENLRTQATTTIDAHGCFIIPGGIDVHVHMPWPTGTYISKDDIFSGTRAAAFGGVTTVIDFAIPGENESLSSALNKKSTEAQKDAWVDYSFHLNIRGDVYSKLAEVPELVQNGFPSFKVFMAYEGFRLSDQDLLEVMETVNRAGGMVNVHAENGQLADHITQKLLDKGKVSPLDYFDARPEICETEAISRLLSYQRITGVPLHIHHVSTRLGAELIKKARNKNLPVTAETCPQYLLLNTDSCRKNPSLAAYMNCAPSIKGWKDQKALWKYLAEGSLPILATDHCPYSKQQKEEHMDNFSLIPGGIGGVELRLPLIFSEGVTRGKISLERFVQAWATEPAKAFGLYPRKGILAAGSDADLVIFDPEKKGTINAKNLHMNTDCLPYEGWEVSGLGVTTILRGEIVIKNGKLVAKTPTGEFIPRHLEPRSMHQTRRKNWRSKFLLKTLR
jgi:dihydropyrimidinase